MSQTCPTCDRPVDPLRARSVVVRDGKVVAYCSQECVRADESRPTAVATTRRTDPEPAKAAPAITAAAKPAASTTKASRPTNPEPVPTKAETVTRPAASKPVEATLTKNAPPAAVAAPVSADDAASPGRARISAPVVIALVLVLGGAGTFLVYRYLIAKPGDAAASRTVTADAAAAAPVPVVDAGPPPVTAEVAVTRAREVLATGLGSDSPRVQRVAAAALARTGDPAAIVVLAAALIEETTDAGRLDLAYALARGGDARGTKALLVGLRSPRRDARIQASRMLAQLGDARAIPPLASYLDVSQLRLGAAEVLANLAEPRAIKALDATRADAKSSPDDRARATIALAIAGRTDVAPDLHLLLDDQGFNAFAASALARLGDPAARPVLLAQLKIPSLRVGAARALRRLDPAFRAGPELPALLAALDSDKDTEQLQVAEAILLLAGDIAWSEWP